MAEKITRKDLFIRIAEVMNDDPQVVEMCEKYIAQLSKPRKRKENPEVAAFRKAMATWLADQAEPVTNRQAMEAMEVSAQKSASALNWLAANGYAVKFAGEKKSDPATYQIAAE